MEVEARAPHEGEGENFYRGYICREHLELGSQSSIRKFNIRFHEPLPSGMPFAFMIAEDLIRLMDGDDRIWGPLEPLFGLTRLTSVRLGDIPLIGDGITAQMENYEALREAIPGCYVDFGESFTEARMEFGLFEGEEEPDE